MMEAAAEEQGISTDEVIEGFFGTHRPHIEVRRPGQIDEVGPLVDSLPPITPRSSTVSTTGSTAAL